MSDAGRCASCGLPLDPPGPGARLPRSWVTVTSPASWIGGRSVWVFKTTNLFERGVAGPRRIENSWGVVEAAATEGRPAVTGPAPGSL